MMKGIGASPGIAIGKALVVEESEIVIEKKSISDIDSELKKLSDAVLISKEELTKVKEKVAQKLVRKRQKYLELTY